MPTLTRDERLDRQELDDGASEAMVFISDRRSSGGAGCYHADSECKDLAPATPREVSREAAQRRWLAPCLRCVIDEVVG